MEAPEERGLEGPRIRFDRLRLENIYTHYRWNNDPELNRLDSEVPFAEESFGSFKKRFERLVAHPRADCLDFEIHEEDHGLIGVAFISGISGHHKHCSVGVTIGDRGFWGKGYGREAMDILLAYCFDSLGMHRVTASVFAFNDAWRKLVEGMGFTTEGTDRDYLLTEGQFYDRIRYAMLADEYAGRARAPRRVKSSVRKKSPGAAA